MSINRIGRHGVVRLNYSAIPESTKPYSVHTRDNLVYDQVIDISETVYFNSSVLSNVMRRKH